MNAAELYAVTPERNFLRQGDRLRVPSLNNNEYIIAGSNISHCCAINLRTGCRLIDELAVRNVDHLTEGEVYALLCARDFIVTHWS